MALTLLCVVMLIDAQTQQHKLILLLQTESKREREKKRQLFGKYIALYNEHLEIPSHRAARREGGKNLPALILCVGLGGYMIDRASCVLVIIPLRRSRVSRTDLSIVVTGVHRGHT